MSPPKYVIVPTLGLQNVTVLGNVIRNNEVIRVGSSNLLGVLIKRGNVNTERHRRGRETQGEDSHVPRENAKGFCKHRKLEEIRKDPPLELSEEAWCCRHLDFRLLGLQTESTHLCWQKPFQVWYFAKAAQGNKQTHVAHKAWNLQRP